MWAQFADGKWSEGRKLNVASPRETSELQLVTDASGRSLVCWTKGFEPVEAHLARGSWTSPAPVRDSGDELLSYLAAAVSGTPSQIDFFYVQFVTGFLPHTSNDRLMLRSLREGRWLQPHVVTQGYLFDPLLAADTAAGGRTVLAFAGRAISLLGDEGPPQLFLATRPAGKATWSKPAKLASLNPDGLLTAIACCAGSGGSFWVAYSFSTGIYEPDEVQLVGSVDGGELQPSTLEGWPRHCGIGDFQPMRIISLADKSLVIIHACGPWLELAHCWDGKVLAAAEEKLPSAVSDVDIDSRGRLHVVGVSGKGLWYRRATPSWTR